MRPRFCPATIPQRGSEPWPDRLIITAALRRPVRAGSHRTNDPESRNTGKEYVQWRQRLGFGVGVVYQIIKIVAA